MKARIGMVARDKDGNLIKGVAKRTYAGSVLAAETIAITEGLKCAVEPQWRSVAVETDSPLLWSSSRREKANSSWETRYTIADINMLKNQTEKVEARHISREGSKLSS